MEKKNYSKQLLWVALLSSMTLFSQETEKQVNRKITNTSGQTEFVSFNENVRYSRKNASDVIKEHFNIKEGTSFNLLSTQTDELGFTHEKYQLYLQGILVEFATFTIHHKKNILQSITGEGFNLNNVNTLTSISSESALQSAIRKVNAKSYLWENKAEAAVLDNYKKPIGDLVLLPVFEENKNGLNVNSILKLAYKFDIYATNPISRGDVYVDATNGDVLFYNAIIKHATNFGHGSAHLFNKDHSCVSNNTKEHVATLSKSLEFLVSGTAQTRYSGTQSIETTLSGGNYILKDATRGNGINTYNMNTGTNYNDAVNFTDNDNNWSTSEHNANKDNGALDAHWGAEKTYDYWSAKHNRNSFNGSGAAINSYIHFDSNYDNAFWDGSRMTYGDGSGTYFDILTSIDVAAHEIGHAVCTYTANLAYQRESGALNEGFSDIWGAAIEYYVAPTKQTWLIGEDIERRSGHLALRSMSNPKSEGQPDTYGGTYWKNPNCGTPTQFNDYCGVHTNSGVLNHWFYILSVGKSGTNDIGSSYNVTGISIDKAAKIAYRLEATYLSANSTFANARTYGIQAATDLYGANSAEVIATTNAWYAVGVGDAFQGQTDTQAPSTPLNLVASNVAETTVTISWNASTDNVGVVGYDVYSGASNLGTVTSTSASIAGLTANTSYSFTVKAKDAAGNVSGSSNTVTVKTLGSGGGATCAQTISNFPYSESFENTLGAWAQDNADDFDWIVDANGTPSSGTGPSSAAAGTYYVYVESSSPNYPNKKTILNSPCFDLSTTNTATASFKYHLYGTKQMGSLVLEASTNNGATWTSIWSTSSNQGNSWKIGSVNLNSYTGSNLKLRFIGTTGTTWQGDMAIDDFSVVTASAPVCTNVNINLKFDNYPEETSWQITNASGQVVQSGGTYRSQPDGSSLTITKCLDSGCYTFKISDVYGDGICCSYGSGNYSVTSNGVTLVSGSQFGASESTNFCVGINGIVSNIATSTATQKNIEFNMYPNPVTGKFLNIIAADGLKDYKVYNVMGQTVLHGEIKNDQIDVSNLEAGVYVFEMNTYKEKISKKFIKQ